MFYSRNLLVCRPDPCAWHITLMPSLLECKTDKRGQQPPITAPAVKHPAPCCRRAGLRALLHPLFCLHVSVCASAGGLCAGMASSPANSGNKCSWISKAKVTNCTVSQLVSHPECSWLYVFNLSHVLQPQTQQDITRYTHLHQNIRTHLRQTLSL